MQRKYSVLQYAVILVWNHGLFSPATSQFQQISNNLIKSVVR